MKNWPRPIIFTGARGRLAGVLATYFSSLGAEVVRVSRTGGEGHLSYDDLWNSTLLQSGGILLHAAWSTVPSTAEAHPESTWTQDLPLLARLLAELARAPQNTAPHLVFFSSGGAVYGECQNPAKESDPLKPVGWYGRGKVAAERLIQEFCHERAVPASILRISNPYGFPYLPEKPQGIVGAALHAMRTGRALALLGGGTSRKDFLHLSDLQSALESVLQNPKSGIWNVSAGESHSIVELLSLLETITGQSIPRREVASAPWDVHSSLLDQTAFSSAYGWKPRFSLPDGLREMLSSRQS
jgi:UDP-glucose 4-epimerase